MGHDGIVFYGPPASGKDAITRALRKTSPRCVLFEKLKAGDGRRAGYRLTTPADIERMQNLGLIVYANERYGNVYAVDRPSLDALFARGLVPVVHMGQLAGVRALKAYPAAWLSVLVWCPRGLAETRARERGTPDLAARLAAWDETAQDLQQVDPSDFSLRIRTDRQSPAEAAEAIRARLAETVSSPQSAQAP
jgi:guanylate kinase